MVLSSKTSTFYYRTYLLGKYVVCTVANYFRPPMFCFVVERTMRDLPLSGTAGRTPVSTEEVDPREAVDMRLLTGANASTPDCVASIACFIRAKLDGRRSAVVPRRAARRFA